jgi:hypothetical protein
MKLKYVGKKPQVVAGLGGIEPGDVIGVPEPFARALLARGDFEQVADDVNTKAPSAKSKRREQ